MGIKGYSGDVKSLTSTQLRRFVMQLRVNTDVPLKTLCDIFDLDYTHIKRQIAEQEAFIKSSVWQQKVQSY